METLGNCSLLGGNCLGRRCKNWGSKALTDCFYNSKATEHSIKEVISSLEKMITQSPEELLRDECEEM